VSPAHGTAAERLERILYILPAAHRQGGASLDELARSLGVDRATILSDLEQVTAREFYHPAGTVEAFTATIEADRVTVWTTGGFERPVRLNQREALALQLGLRVLAADRGEEDRADLLALADRLQRELTVPETPTVHVHRVSEELGLPELRTLFEEAPSAAREPPRPALHERLADFAPDSVSPPEPTPPTPPTEPASVEYDREAERELLVAVGDDVLRGILAEAIEMRRVCEILYLKPGSRGPETRRVAPLHLVYQDGRWYLLAHDLDRESSRIFRLDRMLDAYLQDAEAPAVDAAAELAAIRANAAAYVAEDDVLVTIHYAPAIGPWIAERTGAEPADDGSVMLTHHVGDPHWLVEHVLQYGGDAWVEEPPELRDLVADAAAALG